MNDRAYEFYINHDLAEYSGRWIAIVDEEVVASGDNARVVLDEAVRKRPGSQPALARVPKDEVLIL